MDSVGPMNCDPGPSAMRRAAESDNLGETLGALAGRFMASLSDCHSTPVTRFLIRVRPMPVADQPADHASSCEILGWTSESVGTR